MCPCKVLTYELIIKSVMLDHNHPPDPLLTIEYGGDLDKLTAFGFDEEEFEERLA